MNSSWHWKLFGVSTSLLTEPSGIRSTAKPRLLQLVDLRQELRTDAGIRFKWHHSVAVKFIFRWPRLRGGKKYDPTPDLWLADACKKWKKWPVGTRKAGTRIVQIDVFEEKGSGQSVGSLSGAKDMERIGFAMIDASNVSTATTLSPAGFWTWLEGLRGPQVAHRLYPRVYDAYPHPQNHAILLTGKLGAFFQGAAHEGRVCRPCDLQAQELFAVHDTRGKHLRFYMNAEKVETAERV